MKAARRSRTVHLFRRVGLAAAAVVVCAGCSSATSNSAPGTSPAAANSNPHGNADPTQVGADGVTNIPSGPLQTQLDALPNGVLTPDEQAGLIWMREEEKLARDVYTALYDRWKTPVFNNIASAEQTHTDAVKTLLDRYAIADPAAGTATGIFINPDIQALYTNLVSQGDASLVAALTVGATIEDLDIADLQARATTTPDIALVYANLEKGSRNHLRSFTNQLQANGAIYTPTHITPAAYDAIVSSGIERGANG